MLPEVWQLTERDGGEFTSHKEQKMTAELMKIGSQK